MISRYIVAVSTTSGSSLIRPTSHRAHSAMTRNDATPQPRQNPLHSAAPRARDRTASRPSSDRRTARPTSTPRSRPSRSPPRCAMQPQSRRPRRGRSPTSSRVTMPVDSGATRFDAVAGKPTCRICRAETSQPRACATSIRSLTASQYIHSAKLDQPRDHERPRRAVDAERRQPGPAEDQKRADQYLQQRTDRHHDARHRGIAGRTQHVRADHRRCEEREADEPHRDVAVWRVRARDPARRAVERTRARRARRSRRTTRRTRQRESGSAS